MQYLESQQRESEAAKEEAKRLRVKMKTYERYVFGVSVYVSTRGLNPGAYTHVYEHSNGVCVCVRYSLDMVLQGQRAEVEAMISDMGVGQSAVEQLSIYCISLKK